MKFPIRFILGCLILHPLVVLSSSSSAEIPTTGVQNRRTLDEVVEHAELINNLVSKSVYSFTKELDEFKREFSLVATNDQEVQNTIQGFEKTIEKIEKIISNSDEKFETLKSENTATQLTLADLQLQFQSGLDKMDRKFEDLLSKNKEMERAITDLQIQLTNTSHQVVETEKKCNALELENTDLRKMLQNTTQRVETLEFVENTTEQLHVERVRQMELQEYVGWTVSVNETDKATDNQENGCGGILVGESGQISYRSPFTTATSTGTSKVRCIWTVRANRKSSVTFQLETDQLGTGVLKFTPLKATLSGRAILRNFTKTLGSSDRNAFSLEGPVVFVTLIGDSSQPLNFTLKYQGTGEDEKNVNGRNWTLYSHYHFRETNGSVDFPKIRGVDTYSDNEIATFVLNPPRPTGGLKIQTTFVDIEGSGSYCVNCVCDSLTHYGGDSSRANDFARHGPTTLQRSSNPSEGTFPTDQRFCEHQGTLEGQIGGNAGTESFISIFKSDYGIQYSGFRFNWEMPFH